MSWLTLTTRPTVHRLYALRRERPKRQTISIRVKWYYYHYCYFFSLRNFHFIIALRNARYFNGSRLLYICTLLDKCSRIHT
jgi:hypothetical protein